MTARLPPAAAGWFDQQVFPTLSTIQPDGRPQLSVVWCKRDGEHILVSTLRGRRKQQNMSRDPRATLLVTAPDGPYSYLEVRARVEMTEEGGRALIDELNDKYTGEGPFPNDPPGAVRVVVRLVPEKVHFYE
jgi:PPOX class probable F420-dependent enzyme